MASRKKEDLDPILVAAYNKAETKFKELYPLLPQPFLTTTYRSLQEQDELYKIGRSLPGKKITNAKAGQSKHNVNPSKAFDIAFITLTKKLDWNKDLFKKFYDLIDKDIVTWGGLWSTFKDLPHYELK